MSKKEIRAAKEGLDAEKTYVARRPEEPPSHYLSRLKFIKNVLEGEPDISDELVEVLSFSYTNIRTMACKYPARIMSMVKKVLFHFFKNSKNDILSSNSFHFLMLIFVFLVWIVWSWSKCDWNAGGSDYKRNGTRTGRRGGHGERGGLNNPVRCYRVLMNVTLLIFLSPSFVWFWYYYTVVWMKFRSFNFYRIHTFCVVKHNRFSKPQTSIFYFNYGGRCVWSSDEFGCEVGKL